MVDVVKREPITKVEDNEIVAHYDDCGFWSITSKGSGIDFRTYQSDDLCYKSEDYILGFLHALWG